MFHFCSHMIKTQFDLYSSGSTIYLLDSAGNDSEVVAWAKSTMVARAAFDHLCRQYPDRSFEMRRKAWVEEERVIARAPPQKFYRGSTRRGEE